MSNRGLVCGVGNNDLSWSGQKNKKYYNEYEARVYNVWYEMLRRCYSKKYQQKQPSYIGCSVCDEWKLLSNFAHDIRLLPGYSDWKNNPGVYDLDKDTLVSGNKVYSPSTCQFITQSDNARDATTRIDYAKNAVILGRPVVAVSPSGDVTEYFGTSEAARQLGCNHGVIINICNKKYGSSTVKKGPLKGWSFYWSDEYRSVD